MGSDRSCGATVIKMPELKANGKGKDVVEATTHPKGGWRKGGAIFDFILRLCAIAAALGAAATMGTTDDILPFFTQFFHFQGEYDDFPVFIFFVIGNAMASAYLVLSLPFSVVCTIRPLVAGPRLLLLICDTVMMALTIAAAAAAASVVYLAHKGNSDTNWLAICQQFGDFCQTTGDAVVGSFVAAAVFMFLIVLSAFALRRN